MSSDTYHRREFLGGLLATTGLLSLGGMSLENQVAYALDNAGEEYKDRYFVFLYMNGGWDVLLSVDPRDPTVFTEAQVPNTLIQHGYGFQNLPNGAPPVVDTPLGLLGHFMGETLNHTDKISIVRGLSMETLGHIPAYQRLVTGQVPVGSRFRGSSFDVWAASLLGKEQSVANLSMNLRSSNLDQPGYASPLRVQFPSGIYDAISRKTPFTKTQEAALAQLFKDSQACPQTAQSPFLTKAAVSHNTITDVLAADLASSFQLNAATPEIQALKEKYTKDGDFTLSMQAVAMASQALKTGLSRVVTAFLAPSYPLDTHGDMDTNGPSQERGFDAFARLIDDLSKSQYKDTEDTWLDRTTVMLSSEFARYPTINQLGGRDHWLMNAMVLAGGDIKPGKVVGASSDVGMMPVPANLETGDPDPENGEILKPEHIYRTLFEGLGEGEDLADLRVDPIKALLK